MSKAVFGIAAVIVIVVVIAFSIPYQAPQEDSISIPPTLTEPIQQQVPAPGFEDVPEMIVVSENGCDPSYPGVCIPPYPPDLDCGEIRYANFEVLQPDEHGFDPDKDGIGCES